MNKNRKLINALLVSTMMLSNVVPAGLAAAESGNDNAVAAENVHRIAGKTRVETSIKLSERAYDSAETVVIAGFGGDVDALTGTLLAKENNAPLLFVSNKEADIAAVNAEIERLGAETVYVLGGEGVVSDTIKDSLKADIVTRVSGKDRWETAIEVAKKVGSETGRAFVTSDGLSGSLTDALATGPASGIKNSPILLTSQGKLSSSTKKAFKELGITDVVVIGGAAAVSNDVLQEITDAGINVEERVYGRGRWETAEAIAERYFPEADSAIVANDTRYADALVGGYFGAKENAPILLTNTKKLSDAAKNFLGKEAVSTGYILGGTSVVSENVNDEMEVILASEKEEGLVVESVSAINGKVTAKFEEDIEELPEGLVFTIDGEKLALTEENAKVVDGKLEITVDEIEAPEEGVTEVTYAVTLGEVTEEVTLKVAAIGVIEPGQATDYAIAKEAVEAYEEKVVTKDDVLGLVEDPELLNEVSAMKTLAFNKVQLVEGEEKEALLDRLDAAHDRVIAATVVRSLQDATEDLTEDNLAWAKNKLSSANRVPKLVADEETRNALMELVRLEEAKIEALDEQLEATEKLALAKEAKKLEIDELELDTEAMSEASIEEAEAKLAELKKVAKEAVDALETVEEVEAYEFDATEAEDLLLTVEEQELADAKETAIEELKEAGIDSEYKFGLINKAKTVEGVETLKNQFLAEKEEKDAEIEAQELEEYKKEKVKIIDFLTNLTDDQENAFKQAILEAEDKAAVDAVLEDAFKANIDEDALELAKYKDAKVRFLDTLDNLTKEQKNDFATEIYLAANKEAVDTIVKESIEAQFTDNEDYEAAIEFAKYKDAKVKIISFLHNLTQEEKDAFASRIYVAKDADEIDTILEEAFEANINEDAMALAKYKDNKVKEVEVLVNITEKTINKFVSDIYAAEDKGAVDELVEFAKMKDNRVKALEFFENLSENQRIIFASEINMAETSELVDKVFDEAFKANVADDKNHEAAMELAKYKDEKVKELRELANITKEEKDAFASRVYAAAHKEAVDLDLAKAKAIDELKGKGIDSDYYFNLINESKTVKGVESIKNKVLDNMN